MRKPLTSWLLGTALLLAPIAARAEEPTKSYPECSRAPTDGEVAAAKGAYQAGTASFDEADYARAIDYWEDAYRRDCTADALLLNLARAYELSGRKRQAVVALETYVQREPNSGGKDQINRRIEVLKKQIAQETATPAATPTATPQPTTQPGPTATPMPTDGQPMQEPQPEASQGKRSVVPLVVAGAGGLVLIVGAAIWLPARSDVARYESHCDVPSKREGCPASEIDAANAAQDKQSLGGWITGGGAVIAAGGLVWYFVSPRKPAPVAVQAARRTELTPAVGPGYAGLSVSGSF